MSFNPTKKNFEILDNMDSFSNNLPNFQPNIRSFKRNEIYSFDIENSKVKTGKIKNVYVFFADYFIKKLLKNKELSETQSPNFGSNSCLFKESVKN